MEELNNTLNLLKQYLQSIWIKKRFIIISTWLICPIGFLIVSTMPDIYESRAKVYADTRSMLKPLLRGLAIQTNPDSEIKLIARTLLARPNLEEIARETDLDILATDAQSYEALIDQLASRIRIKSAGRQNLYTISFEHARPDIAQKVVDATMNKFVETTLGQSRQDSDTASKFLAEQITDYVLRLEAAEKRLADFKRENSGLLPGDNSNYYSQVSVLTKQVEALDLEIKEKQTMLSDSRVRIKAMAEESGGKNSIATQYDQRIALLESDLDELLIRFTEAHPDVKETRRRLAYLETLRTEEIEAFNELTEAGELPPAYLSDNVLVQQLGMQISDLENHLASLQVRKRRFDQELNELNDKIDILPDIEAKLTALNRDYKITKGKYEELLSRKESADLSRKAEESAEDIQFKVIEPPRIPLKPTGPKRNIFYTLVLIAGFGTGLGLAFLLSQINPSVTSISQLTSLTGRPVLGFVSHIHLAEMRGKNVKRMWLFILSSSMILIIYSAFIFSEVKFSQSLTKKYSSVFSAPASLVEKLL